MAIVAEESQHLLTPNNTIEEGAAILVTEFHSSSDSSSDVVEINHYVRTLVVVEEQPLSPSAVGDETAEEGTDTLASAVIAIDSSSHGEAENESSIDRDEAGIQRLETHRFNMETIERADETENNILQPNASSTVVVVIDPSTEHQQMPLTSNSRM